MRLQVLQIIEHLKYGATCSKMKITVQIKTWRRKLYVIPMIWWILSFFPASLRRSGVIALHIPIFGLNCQQATHPELSFSTRLSVCYSLSVHVEAASFFKQHNESFAINGTPTRKLNSKTWSLSPTCVNRWYPSVVKRRRSHDEE